MILLQLQRVHPQSHASGGKGWREGGGKKRENFSSRLTTDKIGVDQLHPCCIRISAILSVSPVKISHIGIDGSPVANEVGGIGMIRTEYSFPDEQGLSSHFIRVADQILQRLQGCNLVSVVVSQLVCRKGG